MQQLLPTPAVLDDVAAVLGDDERPQPAGRPWVMANMVASVDGAYAVGGRSAPLGGPADRTVFHALRAAADVVLVAAGTARAEHYRRPRAEPWAQEARRRRGQGAAPRLVLVSRSLHLPADLPLLRGDGPVPLLLHPKRADAAGLPDGVESRPTGVDAVDLAAALVGLAADGARTVLCEGGPQLLGDLVRLDVVDELFLTVSPRLVGGDRLGLLHGTPEADRRLLLHRALADDDLLLLTYRRRRD